MRQSSGSKTSSRARIDPRCWAASAASVDSSPSTRRSTPSPVLVASADGVGTKLDIARQVGRYDSVGIDLVAMLVDDLACVGAEPLFLLGLRRGREARSGAARRTRRGDRGRLSTGEDRAPRRRDRRTRGVMAPDDLDVAGFAVGVVERGEELGPRTSSRRRRPGGFRVAGTALQRLLVGSSRPREQRR